LSAHGRLLLLGLRELIILVAEVGLGWLLGTTAEVDEAAFENVFLLLLLASAEAASSELAGRLGRGRLSLLEVSELIVGSLGSRLEATELILLLSVG